MPTPKDTIREILAGLDHTNDKIWTEDGAPLVSEICRLANDKTITRSQINDAEPGFVRVSAEAIAAEKLMAPPADAFKVTDTPAPDDPNVAKAAAPEFDPSIEPEVNGPGQSLSEDEVRMILNRRVHDAEQGLSDARAALSAAQAEVIRCEKRLNRAHEDHNRQFPAITAAANIKAHLAAQGELARKRAGLGESRSQVDISMERSNRRGWTRPTRPVQNASSAAA